MDERTLMLFILGYLIGPALFYAIGWMFVVAAAVLCECWLALRKLLAPHTPPKPPQGSPR